MFRPFTLLAMICTVLVVPDAALAQSTGNGTPSTQTPVPAAAPATGSWTMTMRNVRDEQGAESEAEPTKNVKVRSVQVRKYQGTGETRVSYTDGTAKVFYHAEGAIIMYNEAMKRYRAVDVGGRSTDFETAIGFHGLDWVKPAHFKGEVTLEGKKCLHFANDQGGAAQTSGEGSLREHQPTDVWIDPETRLPVAVRLQEGTISYTFAAPPEAPVTIPAAATAALKEMKMRQLALKSMEMR